MRYIPENPLIVQGDHSLLLETMGPRFREARDALLRFAELVKSPEYVHTWRITPLSLWNAAAAGLNPQDVIDSLERFSKYDIPPNVPVWVQQTMGRYGRLVLLRDGDALRLEASDSTLMEEIARLKQLKELVGARLGPTSLAVETGKRGELKQALVVLGHPVDDRAGYVDGEALEVVLRHRTLAGKDFQFRAYQHLAVESFLGEGSGVIVLPCGAGKTIVGIGVMAELGMKTLVLCTGITALRQWRDEILDKTNLRPEDVGEYSGETKQVRPITLATYQVLTWRRERDADFAHFGIFDDAGWGLIVYDEVHLLPAPVFRSAAQLQARRRLGLTATLVREDGHETDVFALIGPKRYDVPWKDLEHQGWIANAACTELRIGQTETDRLRYAVAGDREKFRVASENELKLDVLEELLRKHSGERILVIGMYIDQLQAIAERLDLPLITGQTPQDRRDELYASFRRGEVPALVISKVGNFSVDLPDASVAVQVSGTWGSRQEEAQRLGRILRPKSGENRAYFYTLVTRDTIEQDYAEKRQLFLTEQGYTYSIEVR